MQLKITSFLTTTSSALMKSSCTMGSKNKMGLISVLRKEWTFRSMEMFLILTTPKVLWLLEWENVIIHLRLETNKYSKHTFIRFCVAPYTINNCTRCRVDISDIFTYYILIVIICFRRPSLQPRRVPPRHGAGEGGGELDPILIPSSCHLLIPHPHLRLRL